MRLSCLNCYAGDCSGIKCGTEIRVRRWSRFVRPTHVAWQRKEGVLARAERWSFLVIDDMSRLNRRCQRGKMVTLEVGVALRHYCNDGWTLLRTLPHVRSFPRCSFLSSVSLCLCNSNGIWRPRWPGWRCLVEACSCGWKGLLLAVVELEMCFHWQSISLNLHKPYK